MISTLLLRIAQLALAHPRMLLGTLLIPAVLGTYAFTVPLDFSFSGLMDRGHPEVKRYFAASERYGLGGRLLLLLEGQLVGRVAVDFHGIEDFFRFLEGQANRLVAKRRPDRQRAAQSTAAEISKDTGAKVDAVACDVADAAQCAQLIEQSVQLVGHSSQPTESAHDPPARPAAAHPSMQASHRAIDRF